MDNYTSGSVVESRTAVAQPKTSKNKSLLIIAIVEAVVIVCLAIALIVMSVASSNNNFDGFEDGETGYIEEATVYSLERNDTNVVMLAYSLANNSSFAVNTVVPMSFCVALQNIYNNLPNDDTSMDNPCVGNRISLFSENTLNPDLWANSVNHVGIIVDNQIYNIYAFSDFSAVQEANVSNDVPATTVIVNVGS